MNFLIKFLLVLLLLPSVGLCTNLQVTVLSIHDGDTLTALGVHDKVKYKIRLLGVDTPEVLFLDKTQEPAALEARDYLASLAPVGSEIQIINGSSQVDKNGRVLGRLFKDDLDINKEMLRQGWGQLYFIFPFDKKIVSEYSLASKEAYDNHRGLFSITYQNIQEPYLFRLKVQNQIGYNSVADFEVKKVFSPEEIDKIFPWNRVFFSDLNLALANGYTWAKP